MSLKCALTIAGSDSSGGAGIQADLKTFTAMGVYGMSVITAITAQNTTGVRKVQLIDLDMIESQIDAVAEDFPIHAAKTGMLADSELISLIARKLQEHSVQNYVCDPVIYAKSGAQLVDPVTIHAMRQELLPLATVVTPNRAEAAMLANMEGEEIATIPMARRVAEKIVRAGAKAVLVKGINTGNTMTDVFYDGEEFVEFPAKRINTKNTHGSGCTFSAILTSLLAEEIPLLTAIDNARSCISNAIEYHVRHGSGVRPVNQLALNS